ncbi:MAG TPA: hypothetical protein VHL31_22480 [Geminicoccus sp.]|jgi:hypothetical protein|uniref:hypothetical protein n=1 Tax=Geminicoccus sp. TaxID=2024832 RepID=UPI002E37FEA0|nr:hypothetical protein [Geminicoccus sp.]HEX2529050.1 hypothetical protein [Geminicoccus sp.]
MNSKWLRCTLPKWLMVSVPCLGLLEKRSIGGSPAKAAGAFGVNSAVYRKSREQDESRDVADIQGRYG